MKNRTALRILLALLICPPPAFAQDAEEPAEKAAEAAEEAEAPPAKGSREYLVALVTDGARLYDQGQYPQAIEKLKEAYSIKQSPTIGVVLAHAYRDAGRIGEAIDVYALVSEESVTEDSHEKVVDAVNTAQEQHKTLSAKAVRLNLVVAGPDDYQVTFNGKEATPHRSGAYVLMPGIFTIKVTAEGYLPAEVEFVGQAGRRPFQTIELKQASAAPVAPVAAPVTAAPKQAAAPTQPSEAPEKPKRTAVFRTLGWTSLGLGVASAVGGGMLVFYGSTQNTQAEELCEDEFCDPDAQKFLDNRDQAGNGATIALAVSGGLLVTGITLLVYDGGHRRRHRRRYLDSQKAASLSEPDSLLGVEQLRVVGRPGGLGLAGAF